MSANKGMNRRTRITLALAVLTTFAFGATYGLVAHEGTPQTTVAAVNTQTVAGSTATAPAQSGSATAPSNSNGSQKATATPTPAVAPHTRTRAS
jgi:hypothetical protein